MEAFEGAVVSAEVLDRIAMGVENASSIEDAVALITNQLQSLLALSRVSVRLLREATDELAVIAVWSAEPTQLGPGTAMRARQTSYLEMVRQGRSVVSPSDTPNNLLGDLIAAEGTGSWVAVPIPSGTQPHGVLSICSSATTFPAAAAIFDALGARVGARMYELATVSHWHQRLETDTLP